MRVSQDATAWRKSTFSGTETDCVEIHKNLDAVRDSKGAKPMIAFSRVAVSAFLGEVKSGRYDS